jgi:hypothetical protein
MQPLGREALERNRIEWVELVCILRRRQKRFRKRSSHVVRERPSKRAHDCGRGRPFKEPSAERIKESLLSTSEEF